MQFGVAAAISAVFLSASLYVSVAAQQPILPSTPVTQSTATPIDPQTVLERAEAVTKRADDVTALAKEAAQQSSNTISLMEKLVWAIGILVAVVTGFIGWFGITTINDFKQQLNKYQAGAAQNVETIARNVQEIQKTQQELQEFRSSVTREFENTKQALVLLSLGNRQFSEGYYAEAISTYEEARRLNPRDAEVQYRLGRAYSNMGRYDEAINALAQALSERPDFAEASLELGLAYRRRADRAATAEERGDGYRQGERYLLQAIALRPDYADALATLGGYYRRDGRYDEALKYYKRAALVDPTSSYAISNVASLSWYLGKMTQAAEYFEQTEALATSRIRIGREPIYWDMHDRALARLALSKEQEAIADYEQAIERTPNTENARSVLNNLAFLARAQTEITGLDQYIARIKAKFPEV